MNSYESIELIINVETGETFTTTSGYAKMSGKAESTISKRIAKRDDVKTDEIITPWGLKTFQLIPVDIIEEWLKRDNQELASRLAPRGGVDTYVNQLAGSTDWLITPYIRSGTVKKERKKERKKKRESQSNGKRIAHSLRSFAHLAAKRSLASLVRMLSRKAAL